MSGDTLPFSPAAERNKQAILERLQALLPAQGSALEIASGPGQHAVWFAQHLPGWHWQPTENDPALVAAVNARVRGAGLQEQVRPAHALDVTRSPWPLAAPDQAFDAIFCANLLHIAPWAACTGLMQGAAQCLAPRGLLITYGPYLEQDVPTSPGNLAFDASLQASDPRWGLRQLPAVAQQAQTAGLQLRERHAMPANNLLLVWAKEPAPA
jgi:phospholipid N-methyltransferase